VADNRRWFCGALIAASGGAGAGLTHAQEPIRQPDRDWEIRLHYPEVGPSIAFYPVEGLSLQAGFGYRFFKDYSFLEPYLSSDGTVLVEWSVGFTSVLNAGLAYDWTVVRGLLNPKDEVALRASLRFRELLIAKIEGANYSPTVGSAGFATSFPLMGGATYTRWILPDTGRVLKLASRVSDLGVFIRAEAGADFITYHMYRIDGDSAELVDVPLIEFIYNTSIGIVF